VYASAEHQGCTLCEDPCLNDPCNMRAADAEAEGGANRCHVVNNGDYECASYTCSCNSAGGFFPTANSLACQRDECVVDPCRDDPCNSAGNAKNTCENLSHHTDMPCGTYKCTCDSLDDGTWEFHNGTCVNTECEEDPCLADPCNSGVTGNACYAGDTVELHRTTSRQNGARCYVVNADGSETDVACTGNYATTSVNQGATTTGTTTTTNVVYQPATTTNVVYQPATTGTTTTTNVVYQPATTTNVVYQPTTTTQYRPVTTSRTETETVTSTETYYTTEDVTTTVSLVRQCGVYRCVCGNDQYELVIATDTTETCMACADPCLSTHHKYDDPCNTRASGNYCYQSADFACQRYECECANGYTADNSQGEPRCAPPARGVTDTAEDRRFTESGRVNSHIGKPRITESPTTQRDAPREARTRTASPVPAA